MEIIFKTIKKLVMNIPIAGLFLLGLRKRESTKIPTAAVSLINGIDIELLINPKFYASLDEKERAAVMYHEVLHIMFDHLFIGPERWPNHQIANIATDCMINTIIDANHSHDRMKLPEWVMWPKNYNLPDLKDSDFYYKELTKINESAQKKLEAFAKGGSSGTGSGAGKGSQSPENPNQPSPNSGEQGEDGDGDEGESGNPFEEIMDEAGLDDAEKALTRQLRELPGSLLEHNWDRLTKGLSDDQKKMISSNIKGKLKQTIESDERTRGSMPGYLNELVEELFRIEEEVFDWKSFLKRYVGSMRSVVNKKTRKKESLRFEGNPGRLKKKSHKMLFAVDCSGSVSQSDLEECYSELFHLYKKGTKIDVIHWDTSVVHEYEYKGEHSFPRVSAGGTIITCALEHFKKNMQEYTGLVIFTDGCVEETDFKFNKPVLTIVCSGGVDESRFNTLPGNVIKIPSRG
jgi:predicted metal-dependent peptidase